MNMISCLKLSKRLRKDRLQLSEQKDSLKMMMTMISTNYFISLIRKIQEKTESNTLTMKKKSSPIHQVAIHRKDMMIHKIMVLIDPMVTTRNSSKQ